MKLRSCNFALALAAAVTFLCGGRLHAQSCSPIDECCPPGKAIEGPTTPSGGGNGGGGGVSGPTTGVGSQVGADGQQSIDVSHDFAGSGMHGVARCYFSFFAFTNDIVPDPWLLDMPGWFPSSGCVIAVPPPVDPCDPAHEAKFDCSEQSVAVIGTSGVEIVQMCVCAPTQFGSGGAGNGSRPAQFAYAGQNTNVSTLPLIFKSDRSPAELWYHSFWDPQNAYIEVKHTDGTVARFEFAQYAPNQVGLWRLDKVTDPFDNVTDLVYEASGNHRLVRIDYPSGISENWNWSPPTPNGWPSGYSFLEVSYSDRTTSTALPDGTKWGMVFENIGSRTHFLGRLRRVYRPETQFVEPDASFGGFYDLDATGAVRTARPIYDIHYDTNGRADSLLEARFWGDLLDEIGPNDPATSLEEYLSIEYYTDGRVHRHVYTQVSRSYTYTYDETATRTNDVPGSLSRTTRQDDDGHESHFEFYPATGRIYRVEVEPQDNADGRPRAHDAENASLGSNAVAEPTLLRTDTYYDATCVCSKPIRVVRTGLSGAQVLLQRETTYEYYPTTHLLKKVTEPNPSTESGAPSTVDTVYTYVSAADLFTSVEWSAHLLQSVTTPDGVYNLAYEWRDRSDVALHGKMPYRITKSIAGVRIQTDLTTTSTTSLSWVADLDFPDYPSGHAPGATNGKPAIVVDGDGVTTTLDYDAYGRLSSATRGGVTQTATHDAWGRLETVGLNSGAGAPFEATISIAQGWAGETYSASATIGQVPVASELAYDRWGNLCVVRRRNTDSTGGAPTGYLGNSTGRGWTEDQYSYQWHELHEAYADRRPIDQPRGAPFADDPLAWFLKTEYEYSLDGRLKSVRHPSGAKTTYTIDGFGTLYTAETSNEDTQNPQSTRHAKVFVNGLLEPIAYFEGAAGAANPQLWTVLVRNGAGAVTGLTEPVLPSGLAPTGYMGSLGGATRQFSLDALGRIVEMTVGNGTTDFLHVERSVDQLGRVMREEQHAILVNGTPSAGESAVRMWRYADGKESQLGFEREIGANGPNTATFAYDGSSGRLTSVTDDLGDRTSLEYQALTDFIKAVVRRAKDGQNGNQNVDYRTEYGLDALGRVVEIREKGTSATALVHTFAYNSHGLTDTYTDPLGHVQSFLADALGRLVENVRYGTASDPRATSLFQDFLGAGRTAVTRTDGLGHSTSTFYDYAGRPFIEMLPGASTVPTATAPNQPYAYYATYDVASRLTDVYDGDGGHTRFWHDGPGRLIAREATVINGFISKYNAKDLISRDVVGRVVNSGSLAVDANGVFSPNLVELYEPDSLGRVHREAYLPFAMGNVMQVDSTFAPGTGFRTTLDYVDNLSSGSAPLAMEYEPDAIGRLAEIRWNQTPGTGNAVPLADYTHLGGQKRYRKTFLAGTHYIESLYSYDAYGRLSQIKDDLNTGGGPATISQFDYVYDAASNLKKEIYQKQGGQVGDRYVYDDFNRLAIGWLGVDQATMDMTDADVLAGGDGTNVASFVKRLTYGLDDANNRDQVETYDGSTTTTEGYELEGEPGPSVSNRYSVVGGVAPVYDRRGNTVFDGQYTFVYDFANRLTEVWLFVQSGTSAATATQSGTRYAIVDDAVVRRGMEASLSRRPGAPRELARRLQDPAFRDRLRNSVRGGVIGVTGGGGRGPTIVEDVDIIPVAIYNYDIFNRRVNRLRFDTGEVIIHTWDGWHEAQEGLWSSTSGTVPRQQYVWGDTLDELVAYRNVGASTSVYYLTQGGQDTPARLLDSTGTVIQSYEYDVYGAATAFGSVAKGHPLGWKGVRVDPETGLAYMRNRYYSFEWGRFMTHDPLGAWIDEFNWGNAYAYVGNNGLIRGDPFGLQAAVVRLAWGPNGPDGSVPCVQCHEAVVVGIDARTALLLEAHGARRENFEPVGIQQAGEGVAQAAVTALLVGMSCIPGVGEAMDAYVLATSTSTAEKGLAGGSLVLSGASAGFAPNGGALALVARLMGKHVDEVVDGVRAAEKAAEAAPCEVRVLATEGSGAARGGGETLSRLGTSRESASRLGRKAAEAEGQIGIHGVSTTAGAPRGPASQAARRDVEDVFRVHDTPTLNDPLHRTVELPKPVTPEVAEQFNRTFGRR